MTDETLTEGYTLCKGTAVEFFEMLEHSLFHKLPPWTQAELLAQKGIALSQRRFNGWAITLFSFENHFLEVWAKMGVEVVGSFQATATYMEIIEPYMSDLSVPEGA